MPEPEDNSRKENAFRGCILRGSGVTVPIFPQPLSVPGLDLFPMSVSLESSRLSLLDKKLVLQTPLLSSVSSAGMLACLLASFRGLSLPFMFVLVYPMLL